MATSITALANPGEDLYYDSKFKQMIEDHLTYLLQPQNHDSVSIDPSVGDKHDGDFFGLLNELQAPLNLHWIIMRLNGFNTPTDYQSSMLEVKTPNASIIDLLIKRFRTNQSIS